MIITSLFTTSMNPEWQQNVVQTCWLLFNWRAVAAAAAWDGRGWWLSGAVHTAADDVSASLPLSGRNPLQRKSTYRQGFIQPPRRGGGWRTPPWNKVTPPGEGPSTPPVRGTTCFDDSWHVYCCMLTFCYNTKQRAFILLTRKLCYRKDDRAMRAI